jgi:hypothetical protein
MLLYNERPADDEFYGFCCLYVPISSDVGPSAFLPLP